MKHPKDNPTRTGTRTPFEELAYQEQYKPRKRTERPEGGPIIKDIDIRKTTADRWLLAGIVVLLLIVSIIRVVWMK